jgi:hypothetical protein
MVTRNHHDIVVLSRVQYPVELLEGVVQIGNQEASHGLTLNWSVRIEHRLLA